MMLDTVPQELLDCLPAGYVQLDVWHVVPVPGRPGLEARITWQLDGGECFTRAAELVAGLRRSGSFAVRVELDAGSSRRLGRVRCEWERRRRRRR